MSEGNPWNSAGTRAISARARQRARLRRRSRRRSIERPGRDEGTGRATRTYDKQFTALLVIDPYNDFISEGGEIWDPLTGVSSILQEEVHR